MQSLRDFKAASFHDVRSAGPRAAVHQNMQLHPARTTHEPADMEALDQLRSWQFQHHHRPLTLAIHHHRTAPGYHVGGGRAVAPPLAHTEEQEREAEEYQRLLRLDEDAVPKGLCKRFQRQLLKRQVWQPTQSSLPATPSTTSQQGSKQPMNTSCCVICRDDLQRGEEVIVLPTCGHLFHPDCLEPWLEKQRVCPTCRTEVHPVAVPR
jgi:hypothetical protein